MASVKAPLTLHGIEGRYATALFTAATKKSQLPTVEQDMNKLKKLMNSDKPLLNFLQTPILSKKVKLDGVNSLLSKSKNAEVTGEFLRVLAENGRLDHLGKIIGSFEQLMSASKGEVTIVVTSAQELDRSSQSKLVSVLKGSSLVGKSIEPKLVTKVDADIIGGLVIEIGEKTIDLSVSTKINKLNRLLGESV